ncbi:MAG: hypothetical protein JWO86_1884 [Myxococcaceae bacterium]|nr:hypothetical protein [Myxococcaceae bacterium]
MGDEGRVRAHEAAGTEDAQPPVRRDPLQERLDLHAVRSTDDASHLLPDEERGLNLVFEVGKRSLPAAIVPIVERGLEDAAKVPYVSLSFVRPIEPSNHLQNHDRREARHIDVPVGAGDCDRAGVLEGEIEADGARR